MESFPILIFPNQISNIISMLWPEEIMLRGVHYGNVINYNYSSKSNLQLLQL